jgi:multidrug efflux pump subunit AcrB
VEFFPETEPKRAYVNIKAPQGTNLDTSDKLVARVEEILSDYKDIRYVISNIGALGGNPFSQGGTGTHISRVRLDTFTIAYAVKAAINGVKAGVYRAAGHRNRLRHHLQPAGKRLDNNATR